MNLSIVPHRYFFHMGWVIFLAAFLPFGALSQTFTTVISGVDSDGRPTSDIPSTLAISPDSSKVAVGTTKGNVIIVDTKTGAKLSEWPAPLNKYERDPVYSIDFSRDSKLLAVSGNHSITISDADGGNRRPPVPFPVTAQVIRFAPTGYLLATSLLLKKRYSEKALGLCILDAADISKGCKIAAATFNSIDSWDPGQLNGNLLWMPDGMSVFSDIEMYSAKNGQELKRITFSPGDPSYFNPKGPFLISPDGNEAIAFSGQGRFSLQTGKILKGPGINWSGNESKEDAAFATWMPNGKSIALIKSHSIPLSIEIINSKSLVTEGYVKVKTKEYEDDFPCHPHLHASDRFDIYAVIICRVGKWTAHPTGHSYELQVWPMPKMRNEPVSGFE